MVNEIANNQVMPLSSTDVKDSSSPSKSKKRIYQVWQGRNRFLCGGRLIFGPDAGSVLLSCFLIGAPALTFCIKMFLRIPEVDPIYGHVVLLMGCILTVLDLTFLMMTSGSNPGIVPRNSRPPEFEESHSYTKSMEWINAATPDIKVPRTKDVAVNGHIIKVKYCDTCLLYRPPRASHCSICNNCVERFDHHCPWVGQCIGIRNYRCFIFFISTSTILCIYVFTFSLIDILNQPGSLWSLLRKDAVSLILIAYCFIAVWFVGGLTVFHLYLMSTNQTTYENFRYRYDKKENPYNQGVTKNLREIFLSKVRPSLVNFREWVTVIEEEEEEEENDHVKKVGSLSYKFRGDLLGSKGKFDIESGGILGEKGNNMKIPDVLKNLDYIGIEDKLKNEKGGKIVFDPFLFPSAKEVTDLRWNISENGELCSTDDDRTEDSSSQRSSSSASPHN